MPTVNRRWIVAAFALPLVGCATGGQQTAPDISLRSSLRCEIESLPETLPTAGDLVDVSALNADLRDMQEAFDSALVHDRQIAVSMAYQTDGLNMRRDILAHDTEPVVADSVQKLVFAHREQLPEAEQEWGVRLLIDLGDEFTYRVERREYCPPRPRNPEMESAMSTYLGSGVRYEGGGRVRTVVVRVLVHPAGYVASGSLIRGGVTGSSFEQELLTYVRQFSFEPATVDGAPTYGYIDVPVQVRG